MIAAMVRLRVVDEDGRTATQRATALHEARANPEARRRLDEVIEPLHEAVRRLEAAAEVATEARTQAANQPSVADVAREPSWWSLLDQAYAALDRYFAFLLNEAAIDPSCGPRCSACCTDLPPVLPVEALRMARVLRARGDGRVRLQRSVELARAFQQLLRSHTKDEAAIDFTDPRYRAAQLAWRRLGHPCPVLGDDGNCSAYEARPLSCRAHVHVEDPAHCEPGSPRFTEVERPPLWGHPREVEVELALAKLSRLLGLPSVPNLQWGLARLHDHALAR